MRERVMRKASQPGHAIENAGFHSVTNVGEDSGSDSAALQFSGPVDHGQVGLRPKVDVGGVECGYLAGVDRAVEVRRN